MMGRWFVRMAGTGPVVPTNIWDVIYPDTYEPREGWIELTATSDNGPVLHPTVEAGVVNALQMECGETSQAHGFKNDWLWADWLESLAEYLSKEERFTADVTQPFGLSTVDGLKVAAVTLRNNILGTKLALIHSELSEALESLRENGGAQGALDGQGNFGEELADAIVRILDTGTFTKDNLGDELLKKMAVNKDRPMMHGGKAM